MAEKKPIVLKPKVIKKPAITEASGEQCFWINFGPIVKNLSELKKALWEISDEQFDYHTKRNGNDFTRWIEEVLGKKELAKKLARVQNRKKFAEILEKSI